jgi:hypothetical protein
MDRHRRRLLSGLGTAGAFLTTSSWVNAQMGRGPGTGPGGPVGVGVGIGVKGPGGPSNPNPGMPTPPVMTSNIDPPSAKPPKKRGVCLPMSNDNWPNQVTRLNVGWFHSGDSKFPVCLPQCVDPRSPSAPDFVPSFATPPQFTKQKFAGFLRNVDRLRVQNLLTFQDPDVQGLSVNQALDLWLDLEDTGLRLGSPVVANPLGDWLKRFLDEAQQQGLRVDFLAVQGLGPNKGEAFLRLLDKLNVTYKLPIWITNLAVVDRKASAEQRSRYTEEDVRRFMELVVPVMNTLNYVERFAWRSVDSQDPQMGTSALFNEDGSLTQLGHLYAGL